MINVGLVSSRDGGFDAHGKYINFRSGRLESQGYSLRGIL
jgi:hypothetical protein